MASAFTRTFAVLRYLKQPFSHNGTVRYIVKTSPNVFLRSYVQCHCYHGTSPSFAQKNKTETKPDVRQSKLKGRKVIDVWQGMTIQEFADAVGKSYQDLCEALHYAGIKKVYAESEVIEDTTIFNKVSKLLGLACRRVKRPGEGNEKVLTEEDIHRRKPVDEASLIKRRPVVTVMGHVDHGKTTLLDALRSTSVVESEFGGITQHIGAFNVTLNTGESMTFLDTPGHAAFTAMRARGAQVTDIVVLVVAADDGVMAQTVQSIEMAKEANVPIVVAINKIDKPNADIKQTRIMLAEQGIVVEELGGDIQAVPISALKKTNLDVLVEAVAIQAELMNLRGDPKGLAEGVVIECSNNPGRGKLATILVQRGALKRGTIIVCGLAWAKVRSMFDDSGSLVAKASLSEAVQVIGWREMPHAGDEFLEVESETKASKLIKFRESQVNLSKSLIQNEVAKAKWEAIRHEYEAVRKKRVESRRYWYMKWNAVEPVREEVNKLNVLVKGDVSGSVEAILDIFDTYNQDKDCRLNVVNYGVGAVTETDVAMAALFSGIIYRFNVNIPLDLTNQAKEKNVSVRPFNVIYNLVDDVKEELKKKMPMIEVDEIHGEAVVQQEFQVTEGRKKVTVAGCSCTKGNLKMSANFRVMRDNEVIHSGPLASMRHLKEEVALIKQNTDCGLRFKDTGVSFRKGDVIVCYTTRTQQQSLAWDPGF